MGTGNPKQVDDDPDPAQQALVGDYSRTSRSKGEKANADAGIRITLRCAGSTWGWIGAGITVFVVLGLTMIFRT